MHLSFLTPVGALFILAAALPLAALWLNERRARVVRAALRVDAPPLRGRLATAVALACVPLLLGLALAQPVLRVRKSRPAPSILRGAAPSVGARWVYGVVR